MWPARAMRRARERGSRAGQDEPSSSVVGELVVLFSRLPEASRSPSVVGADGPVRYTRGVQRARNRAADRSAHEHGSRGQLTWQAVCTRAARSRPRAGSEVCEAVSMPVGSVSATAGCRSRSSVQAGRWPEALVCSQQRCLAVVWSCWGTIRVVKVPAFRKRFRILLVGGQNKIIWLRGVQHTFSMLLWPGDNMWKSATPEAQLCAHSLTLVQKLCVRDGSAREAARCGRAQLRSFAAAIPCLRTRVSSTRSSELCASATAMKRRC